MFLHIIVVVPNVDILWDVATATLGTVEEATESDEEGYNSHNVRYHSNLDSLGASCGNSLDTSGADSEQQKSQHGGLVTILVAMFFNNYL